jgi:acetyl-CoA synthetase
MEWSPITKPRDARGAPNLADYERARREFSWEQAASLLEGLPGGALNMAHEAMTRHVRGATADRLAIRFLARDVPAQDITYRQLNDRWSPRQRLCGLACSAANVASLMGRVPALYSTVSEPAAAPSASALLRLWPRTGQVPTQLGSVQCWTTDFCTAQVDPSVRNSPT